MTSPAAAATANETQSRGLHRTRPRQTGTDQPQRSDPGPVGATDPVGVVVGVVDPDLERQAHHQGEQRGRCVESHRSRPPSPAPTSTGRDGRRQGPRAGTGQPLRRRRARPDLGAHPSPPVASSVSTGASSSRNRCRSILPPAVRGSDPGGPAGGEGRAPGGWRPARAAARSAPPADLGHRDRRRPSPRPPLYPTPGPAHRSRRRRRGAGDPSRRRAARPPRGRRSGRPRRRRRPAGRAPRADRPASGRDHWCGTGRRRAPRRSDPGLNRYPEKSIGPASAIAPSSPRCDVHAVQRQPVVDAAAAGLAHPVGADDPDAARRQPARPDRPVGGPPPSSTVSTLASASARSARRAPG